VICFIFFAAVLDSCVARFREPLFTVHLLPGGSEPVEGQVDHDLKDLSRLRIENPDERIHLKIDRFQPGFWLGGNQWIGAISAAADAAPGRYDLRVFDRGQTPAKPVSAFLAIVYADAAGLRQSSFSFIRRGFDASPAMIALACVAALGLILGLIFLMSLRVERLLADEGRAEVFHVKEAGEGFEVYFGLGRRHGVEPGMTVEIRSQEGKRICLAGVRQVDADNAMALVDASAGRPPMAPWPCFRSLETAATPCEMKSGSSPQ
jgi:hypothetical protein